MRTMKKTDETIRPHAADFRRRLAAAPGLRFLDNRNSGDSWTAEQRTRVESIPIDTWSKVISQCRTTYSIPSVRPDYATGKHHGDLMYHHNYKEALPEALVSPRINGALKRVRYYGPGYCHLAMFDAPESDVLNSLRKHLHSIAKDHPSINCQSQCDVSRGGCQRDDTT